MNFQSKNEEPSFFLSILPFMALIALLVFIIQIFGSDALGGASQTALLLSAGLCTAIYIIFCGGKWKKIEGSISDSIRLISSSVIILLLIGAISGTWMVSGIVPTLICYGMKVITPKMFLFAACVICALISLATGSSWTTIATVGVAFMGIGKAQGYNEAWIAGAIISGAYFGDKISPLSDTTTLASSSSGTDLFTHIRFMLRTTIPSISIALLIYLTVSLTHNQTSSLQMNTYSDLLRETYHITPLVLIVPVLTAVLIAKRVPAIITLFLASLMAAVTALIAQPHIIWEIGAGDISKGFVKLDFMTAFKGLFTSYFGTTGIDTGNPELSKLIMTKGMTGMLNTIYLIFSAAAFAGAMIGSGMIQSITNKLIYFAKRRTSLVGATSFTGIFCNMVTGDQYLSIILTSSFFKKSYEDNGYENKLLSRTVEDSATVTSVLVPWNTCGMTQSTVLSVSTIAYLPFCFFNLISPLMSIAVSILMKKNSK